MSDEKKEAQDVLAAAAAAVEEGTHPAVKAVLEQTLAENEAMAIELRGLAREGLAAGMIKLANSTYGIAAALEDMAALQRDVLDHFDDEWDARNPEDKR